MSGAAAPLPASAYAPAGEGPWRASELTPRGPWHPDHQHAGPPSALVCRAIERAGAAHGLTHLARLTGNLLRPVPIGDCRVEVAQDYVGRNAAHYSARLVADGREVARFTALMQREHDVALPAGTAGHPLPLAPRPPAESPPCRFPFAGRAVGYGDLVETRLAEGRFFDGPCAAWFRVCQPLVAGEAPSPYQRVAVAADSGNGISAVARLPPLHLRQLRPQHQPAAPAARRVDLPAVAHAGGPGQQRPGGGADLRRGGPRRPLRPEPRVAPARGVKE